MSLKPSLIEAVPSETVRVARAAFPKGNLYLAMRDELGVLFEDADFAKLFPRRINNRQIRRSRERRPAQSPTCIIRLFSLAFELFPKRPQTRRRQKQANLAPSINRLCCSKQFVSLLVRIF